MPRKQNNKENSGEHVVSVKWLDPDRRGTPRHIVCREERDCDSGPGGERSNRAVEEQDEEEEEEEEENSSRIAELVLVAIIVAKAAVR